MIVIPFGSGVVAAFIFLIFELLVFPLLIHSTSKLASIFVYWHARRGNNVTVETMKFPLWSDGLIRNYFSHTPLLVIRVILIAIPVYLETRLIAREEPEMISKTIQDALVPSPANDWWDYQNTSGEHIRFLRMLSDSAFSSCSYTDSDGWVWAKVANVTYVSEYDQEIHCVSDTQKTIFRPEEEIIDFTAEPFHERVSVSISWIEGCAEHFQEDRLHTKVVDPDLNVTAYRLLSLSTMNAANLSCFFADSAKMRDPFDGGLPHWQVWCQKQVGQIVSYYFLLIDMSQLVVDVPTVDYCSNDRNTPSSGALESEFVRRKTTVSLDVSYRESLEFRDKILVSAEHLANVDPDNDDPTLVRPSDITRVVLYTQRNNVTVSVPSGQLKQHTEIGTIVTIIGMAEALVVVMFAMVLSAALRCKWKYIQEPNTVNGLSRCWADTEAICWGEGDYRKWIDLRLDASVSEEDHHDGAHRFVPSRSHTARGV